MGTVNGGGGSLADSLADALVRREATVPGAMVLLGEIVATTVDCERRAKALMDSEINPRLDRIFAPVRELERQAALLNVDLGPLDARIKAALRTLEPDEAASFVFAGSDYAAFLNPDGEVETLRLTPAVAIEAPDVLYDDDIEDDDGASNDPDAGDDDVDADREWANALGPRTGFKVVGEAESPEDLGVSVVGRPETADGFAVS